MTQQLRPTKSQSTTQPRVVIQVIAVLMVCLLPFALAWWLFNHPEQNRLEKTNHGMLIPSPFSVSTLPVYTYRGHKPPQLHKKWVILVQDIRCNAQCMKTMSVIQRIRLALGKDYYRTEAWLATDEPLSKKQRRLMINPNQLNTRPLLIGHVSKKTHISYGSIHLIDPNGNVFMRYPISVHPNEVYEDMKRLLKLSKIG